MDDLITLSREYGSDPGWVVAGGGNTSWKDGDVLYVKASGYPLATIGEDGFARMDRRKLAAIWETAYPEGNDAGDVAERERLVLQDMMNARIPGEERRPSVETMLHDLLPWPLVVHLHPTLVNGLTCGVDGPKKAKDLFGDDAVWIPVTDPGYVLAKVIKESLEDRTSRGLSTPEYIFLANHGVFAGGEDAKEVRKKYERLQKTLAEQIIRKPGDMPKEASFPWEKSLIDDIAGKFFGGEISRKFIAGGELDRFTTSREDASPLLGCLTPDHIVYAGPGAAYIDSIDADHLKHTYKKYVEVWGKPPNVILINDRKGLQGALVTARGEKSLGNAVLLLENALEVCAYTESFGGPLLLEEKFIRFIVNWEVENYRSALASG
jgi:rhamnose utilization protein RhaD (predicted bifunctional aldolase and dehydrogenase)